MNFPRLGDAGRRSLGFWTRAGFAACGAGLILAAGVAGTAPRLTSIRRRAAQAVRDYQALQSSMREMSRARAKVDPRVVELQSRNLALLLSRARERGKIDEAQSLQRELGMREILSSMGREDELNEARLRLEGRLARQEAISGTVRRSLHFAWAAAFLFMFAGLLSAAGMPPLPSPDPSSGGWRRSLDLTARVLSGAAWGWVPLAAGLVFWILIDKTGFTESDPWVPWLFSAGLAGAVGGVFVPVEVESLLSSRDWAGARLLRGLRRNFGPEEAPTFEPLRWASGIFLAGYALACAAIVDAVPLVAAGGLAAMSVAALLVAMRLSRAPGESSHSLAWSRRALAVLAGAGLLYSAMHFRLPALKTLRSESYAADSQLTRAKIAAAKLSKLRRELEAAKESPGGLPWETGVPLSARIRFVERELEAVRKRAAELPQLDDAAAGAGRKAERRERGLWKLHAFAALLAGLSCLFAFLSWRAGPISASAPVFSIWFLGNLWAGLLLAAHGQITLDSGGSPAILGAGLLLLAPPLWGLFKAARWIMDWKSARKTLPPPEQAAASEKAVPVDPALVRGPAARGLAVFFVLDGFLVLLAWTRIFDDWISAWPAAVCGALLIVSAAVLSRRAGPLRASGLPVGNRPWPYWAVLAFLFLGISSIAFFPFWDLGPRGERLGLELAEVRARIGKLRSVAVRFPELKAESAEGAVRELGKLMRREEEISSEFGTQNRRRRLAGGLAAAAALSALAASALWVKAYRLSAGPDFGPGVPLPGIVLLRWACPAAAAVGGVAGAVIGLGLWGGMFGLGALGARGKAPGAGPWFAEIFPRFFGVLLGRIKAGASPKKRRLREEVILLDRYLLSAARLHLPLGGGVRAFAEAVREPSLRDGFKAAADKLDAGFPLSEALGEAFPDGEDYSARYRSAIRAGEESGDLETGLMLAGRGLADDEDLNLRLSNALTYAGVYGVILSLVSAFLLIFVVPTFEVVFEGLMLETSGPTAVVLWLSRHIRDYSFPLFLVFLQFAFLARRQGGFSALAGLIPSVRDIRRRLEEISLCGSLSGLISAGCPVDKALDVFAGERPQPGPSRLRRAAVRVRRGEALSEALRSEGGFSPELVWACSLGEHRGDIPNTLAWLGSHLRIATRSRIETVTQVIERGANAVLGLLVAIIVIGMFLPLFGISTTLGGSL